MDAPTDPSEGARDQATRRLVLRNTLYLTVSQALTVPLSVLLTAVAARYLGAEVFGYAYLAGTLAGFGFLAVVWGHDGVLPAEVAKNRGLAGVMLGSSIAWRAVLSVFVYLLLALGCYLLGYDTELQWALALTCLHLAITQIVAACKDTIRGFERTDIPAYAHVGQQLLTVAVVIPIFLLGGQLRAALLGHTAAALVALVLVWRAMPSVGVGALSARWGVAKSLFSGGTPFVFFGLAMALQPNIDAVFLSKLAPLEVTGWYGVSRRLIGAVLIPATALIGALYPTLCRLHASDPAGFTRATNSSLRSVSLVVVPVALGCALFPDVGIALFSREKFGPAETNLQVMSVFVALVYFSMPLGTAILASGRQKAWSIVQSLCVVTSLVLNPWLIPWSQARFGNGGIGVCMATVVSEVIVVGCGVALAPRGIFDMKLGRTVLLALVAGAAMIGVAKVASPLSPFVSAPLSLLAYALALWLTGGIEKSQIEAVRGFVGRKLSRAGSGR